MEYNEFCKILIVSNKKIIKYNYCCFSYYHWTVHELDSKSTDDVPGTVEINHKKQPLP